MESNSSSGARRIITFLLFSSLLCIILITNDAKIVLEGKFQGTPIQISVVEEEDIFIEQEGSNKDAITTAQNKYHFHDENEQVVDVDKSNENYNYRKEEDTEKNVHKHSSMYSSPRIIIAHACSGSSATVKFAEKIFNAHGHEVLHGGQPFHYRAATVNGKGTEKINKARQNLIDSGSIEERAYHD